ncbi:hypothetical protein ANRL3_02483 [Anaerolineae bacterium]|nr:hypothetical protein ANRL3_02483 [Anaerolineae bacterium]
MPGALFYVVYNYGTYVIAMPINLMSLAYLVLVVLSAYAMIQVLTSIDAKAVQQQLVGAVPDKFGGGVLVFGILFLFQAIGVLFNSLSNLAPSSKLAVAVADLVITPTCFPGSTTTSADLF